MTAPGFFEGMRYPLAGFKYLSAHRELWPYAIRAFIVGVVLFTVLAALAALFLLGIPGRIVSDGFGVKTAFLGCLAGVLGIFGGIFLFALIGNVVAGPYLEAMTERMMADRGRIKETPRGYWPAFWAGLKDQVRRFLLFILCQIALFAALFSPAAFAHPLVALGVSIFFVAIEHLEYPLEARDLRFSDRIKWCFQRLKPTLGFGTTLFVVMPVVGFLLLPAAVCGAVLMEQDLELSKNEGMHERPRPQREIGD